MLIFALFSIFRLALSDLHIRDKEQRSRISVAPSFSPIKFCSKIAAHV
jgi:hypothetical protein